MNFTFLSLFPINSVLFFAAVDCYDSYDFDLDPRHPYYYRSVKEADRKRNKQFDYNRHSRHRLHLRHQRKRKRVYNISLVMNTAIMNNMTEDMVTHPLEDLPKQKPWPKYAWIHERDFKI
jgi:hypothetical protein